MKQSLAAIVLLVGVPLCGAIPSRELPYRDLPYRLGAAHLITRPAGGSPPDFSSPPPREVHRRTRIRVDEDRVVCRLHQVFFNAAGSTQDALLMIPDPGEDASVSLVTDPPLPAESLSERRLSAADARLLNQEWCVLGGNPGTLARFPLPALIHGPLRLRARTYLKVDYRIEFRLLAPPGGAKLLAFAPGGSPEKPLATNAIEVDIEESFRNHCFSPTHRLLQKKGARGRLILSPAGPDHESTYPFLLLWPPRPGLPAALVGQSLEGERHLLLIVPPSPPTRDRVRRSWVLAIDTGGSRRGSPLEELWREVESVLRLLDPEDRFDVLPFSLDPHPLHRFPIPATEVNIARAMEFLRRRQAWGAVNFESAVLTALEVASEAPADRRRAVLLFTDGRTTIGEARANRILEQHRTERIPIFPIASGPDADYYFLEELARASGGISLFERGPLDLAEMVRSRTSGSREEKLPRIELDGRSVELSGKMQIEGPRIITAPLGGAQEVQVDGIHLDLTALPDAGSLPHRIDVRRRRGTEIWRSLLGEVRFPGGADSFRLFGLVPGTPRPRIVATLVDGVGPLGRDRILALSGLLDQGTFDPVPPTSDSMWSGDRFFLRDEDGRWLESGLERFEPERVVYGSARHMELTSDIELAPHLSLGRSVGLFSTTSATILVEPEGGMAP